VAVLSSLDMLQQAIDRLREILVASAWTEWFAQLDRSFAFLLSLPFTVAVVGLWAAHRDRETDEE
jgi:hypothetical protein